jgi:uncharacterized protein (DUF2336 family)
MGPGLMAAFSSLIPELEDAIAHGTPKRRTEALKRITILFLDGAVRFNEDHVRVFDQVFGFLIEEIETQALAELSLSLAPVPNAPVEVVRRLAKNDDIAVASPVLQRSRRLGENDLIEIAKTKSQAHLLAISGRPAIAENVTDVLVERGDQNVVRSVAANRGARLSSGSFTKLASRAENDDELAEKVGLRPDVPPDVFRDLLLKATEVVRTRLMRAAGPETQAEIKRVLAKVVTEVGARAMPRDFSAARKTVDALRQQGRLNEQKLLEFAAAGHYEEMVVALAQLCAVTVDVADRLLTGDRPDPVLILCKSAGWGWSTARSIITARPSAKSNPNYGLDAAKSNFERLSSSTAQRVMRFWQARNPLRQLAL